ncbi:MAG: alcohol dehydrogenase catalytic domain-containing protein [Clostridia bacterium]|nr:alcohol dehydrogenase catalytic domain-containing protein [Clostridia bacterium]
MKGFKLIDKETLKETDIASEKNEDLETNVKVKITKCLITLNDVLRYSGEIDCENVVLGSFGVGIVSESFNNLFGIEKGNRVYIEPYNNCNECYNCKNGETSKCSNVLTAGEDYNGFLSDFVSVNASKVFLLPDPVSEKDALFIGQIANAISIIDKLGVQKGDYVAIIGNDNLAVITALLLIFYQSVPILIGTDDEMINIAKESGVYYTLNSEDNWQKEVSVITGGRMAKNVVYIADSDIPATKAFAVASYNASVAFTGNSTKASAISFALAVKKQLEIHCINGSFGNTATSINILANKAIDLSKLKVDTVSYEAVPKTFKALNDKIKNEQPIHETIVELF